MEAKGSPTAMWLLAAIFTLTLIASTEGINYRLGTTVHPSFYNLTINVYGDVSGLQTTFHGDVVITVQSSQQNVQQITLHKDEIDITGCGFYNSAGQLQENIEVTNLKYDSETQQLTVPLTNVMTPNVNYTLHFQYIGKIRTDMAGLFSASYVDEKSGQTRWLALTQMQRINARYVFPCFDEPAKKAKFELHIGRSDSFNSISNTKLRVTTNEGNNRYMDHFEISPKMSTYLLAFLISDYTARGNLNEFAVVSRPDFYDNTGFSYHVGQRALAVYSEFFQQPYKDMGNEVLLFASSPRFPHNGMENWGLVLYSDAVLVQHEGYTDGYQNKEFTLRIITHETSHMWFGDSVTFDWWSYFWLNEGFARYYEYFMAHELAPEYQLDQQFVVRQMQMIMVNDALIAAQPLTSPEDSVQSPSEIARQFNSFAYAKGASVLRMWRNAMGADKFETAVNEYLKQNHLGSTVPRDLFQVLKKYWPSNTNINLDQMFYDFTQQVGYPYIMVNLTLSNHQVNFEQKRFLLDPSDGSNATYRYTFPLSFTTNLAPNFRNLTPDTYFDKLIGLVVRYHNDPLDWVICNLGAVNYHRVLYDTPILNNIKVALTKSDYSWVPPENRAQIVDDLFNFARAEMLDYVDVFKFIEYMSHELDYIPWYAAYQNMQRVAKRLTPQQLPDFAAYLTNITDGVYKKLTAKWSPYDVVLDVYNRNMQISWLCKYRAADCSNKVLEIFNHNEEKVEPDYRETFYCAAARSTGYEAVLKLYETETFASEKQLLWRAASCTRDYQTHYKNQIIGGTTSSSLKSVGLSQLYEQNPDLVNPIFNMILEDVNALQKALGSWQATAEALSNLADSFTTSEQREKFSNFIEKNSNSFGDSAHILRTALSTVDTNLAWADKRLHHLVWYLKSRNGAATIGLTMATAVLALMTTVFNLF